MKKKDYVVEPIHDLEKETNKPICEALGCYDTSTQKIEISAGKLGKFSLSICDNCLHKFD